MVDDSRVRMFYAGRRWQSHRHPDAVAGLDLDHPGAEPSPGLYGSRFQAVSDAGDVLMFDVFRGAEDWHVHHTYT